MGECLKVRLSCLGVKDFGVLLYQHCCNLGVNVRLKNEVARYGHVKPFGARKEGRKHGLSKFLKNLTE